MKKMKCTPDDYTEADFPATRKDVFFDCYKEHFSLVFRVGLVCFAALIPTLLIVLLRDSYIISAVDGLAEKTEENVAAVYYTADSFYGLMQIFAFTLFGVLFAGVAQILRQTLWNEPVFFGDDFKNGIKSNAIGYGITAFLLATINYLLNLFGGTITYILYAVFAVIILPVAIWLSLHSIYYKLGISASIKNALILYIKTFPVTILLLVCTVVPFWLVMNLITLLLAKYIVFIVLAVLYIVPLTMSWILYASHIFDKYINKEHYPEIYRKGMRRELEEESQTQDMRSLY